MPEHGGISVSVTAGGAVEAYRFIKGDVHAAAGEVAGGISMEKAASGDLFPMRVSGTAPLTASGVIAKGALIVPDANGKGKAASTLAATVAAGGTAVTSTAANGAIVGLAGSVMPEHPRAVALTAAAADGDIIEVALI